MTRSFALLRNYPNPFNAHTVIVFSLDTTRKVRLVVYDAQGRKVRTLFRGLVTAGQNTVIWRATDDAGRAVSSGIYYYRLEAGDKQITRKMVLLR